MQFKKFFGFFVCLSWVAYAGMTACGSSGTSSTSNPTVNSLTNLPSSDAFFKAGSSSSSLSPALAFSASLRKNAVSGTPPALSSITSNSVDTIFWNGLLADIIDGNVSPSQEVISAFYDGLSNCYNFEMNAQNFYLFGNAGTPICYMQNMPGVSSGVSIVSGDATADNLFDQGADTKVVQVNATAMPFDGESTDMTIYLTIYGTGSSEGSAGYAADIALCEAGNSTPTSGNTIRYNSTTGTLTLATGQSGTQTSTIQTSGKLASSNGTIVYDTSQARTASMYFGGSQSGMTFTNASNVTLDGNVMTALMRSESNGASRSATLRSKFVAEFSGSTSNDVAFPQAAFILQNTMNNGGGEFSFNDTSAVEYQDSFYNIVSSNSLLSSVENYAYTDSIFTNSLAPNSTVQSQINNLSCSPTVNIVVNMDGNDSVVQSTAQACEGDFSFGSYCSSGTITQVMDLLNSQSAGGGGS